MKNYWIITYGCQMNKSDSERIAAFLKSKGYKAAPKESRADLIVVNMCSVRQSAVDRVYGKIKDFAKLKIKNEKLKIVLTGCILKKDRKKFAQYFDYILSIRDLPNWPILPKSKVLEVKPHKNCNYLRIQPNYSSYPIAYVPISNGCNNFCSYCVVPYTRGPEIYRSSEEILSEIKNLINQSYKEIWLLGQNVNSYGVQRETNTKKNAKSRPNKTKTNFAELLRMVNDIPGKFWLRFTSPHPKNFSDELIDVITQAQKVSPYLNLPVQSGDNEILGKMNRNYTAEDYRRLVRKIREKIPKITLSTDVIVGFPGETKSQFENTIKLFQEIKFDMAYIAQYSPRPETTAVKMEDSIPKEEKHKREKILTEILKRTAYEKNKKFIGKTIEVLPADSKNGFLLAKSFNYKTVKFKAKKDLIGKFTKVKIINSTPFGLEGKLIN